MYSTLSPLVHVYLPRGAWQPVDEPARSFAEPATALSHSFLLTLDRLGRTATTRSCVGARALSRSRSPSWTVSARTSSRAEEQADDVVADLRLARRRSSLAGARPPPLGATLKSPCAFSHPVRPSAQHDLRPSPRAPADPLRAAADAPLPRAGCSSSCGSPFARPSRPPPISPRPRPPFDPRIPARLRPRQLAELAARLARRHSSPTSQPVAFAKLDGVGTQERTRRRAS